MFNFLLGALAGIFIVLLVSVSVIIWIEFNDK